MTAQHLAQFNIARIRYPLDDPRMREFVENVERVNGLADKIEGFVWRLKDESGHAMNMRVYDDPAILPNLTVWENVEALERFVWQTLHRRFFLRREEWFAPVASGSNPPDAMAVCPCSMGTLAAIASGLADNLIERAADVMLKEARKLVLVPRETPFSAIHLDNMLRLARAGAVILPANPGFYHHPKSVGEVVDFVVARVLDQLAVPHQLMPRWGADPET